MFKNKVLIVIDDKSYKNIIKMCPNYHIQDCGSSKPPPGNSINTDASSCLYPNLLEVVNFHTNSPYIYENRHSARRQSGGAGNSTANACLSGRRSAAGPWEHTVGLLIAFGRSDFLTHFRVLVWGV